MSCAVRRSCLLAVRGAHLHALVARRVEERELLAGVRICALAAHERVGDVEAAAHDGDDHGLAAIAAVDRAARLLLERALAALPVGALVAVVPPGDAVPDRARRGQRELDLEVAPVLEVHGAVGRDLGDEHALIGPAAAAGCVLEPGRRTGRWARGPCRGDLIERVVAAGGEAEIDGAALALAPAAEVEPRGARAGGVRLGRRRRSRSRWRARRGRMAAGGRWRRRRQAAAAAAAVRRPAAARGAGAAAGARRGLALSRDRERGAAGAPRRWARSRR